jgi:hypothetical protein
MRTTLLLALALVAATPALAAPPTGEEPTARPANEGPDGWRCVYENGYWWYYTPENHWLIYQDGKWNPFQPPQAEFAPPNSTQPSYRSRSSRSYSRSVDPGHSLDSTGNTPRAWLWKRLSPLN